MSDLPIMTPAQEKCIDALRAEIGEQWGMHGVPDIVWEQEYRPGRGHDFRWWLYDDDKIATGAIDVYGNGVYAVGEVDWIHGGEDCGCEMCIKERATND